MAKKFLGKLPLAAFVVVAGMTVTGCTVFNALLAVIKGDVVKPTETADSRMLLQAANDILLEREDGVVPTQFGALLGRRVQGGPKMEDNNETAALIAYKGKKFRMYFANVNQYKAGKEIIYWVSAKSCVELVPKEKKEKK